MGKGFIVYADGLDRRRVECRTRLRISAPMQHVFRCSSNAGGNLMYDLLTLKCLLGNVFDKHFQTLLGERIQDPSERPIMCCVNKKFGLCEFLTHSCEYSFSIARLCGKRNADMCIGEAGSARKSTAREQQHLHALVFPKTSSTCLHDARFIKTFAFS